MRIFVPIFSLFFFFSCKKYNESVSTKLLRNESTDYNGNVFCSAYAYDNSDRIISITNYENSDPPAVDVTITYNNNEAILLSHPQEDPLYNRTTEVHLTLDENGRMLKRIEFTQDISKTSPVQTAGHIRYDTLLCTYDAGGLLNKTTESRYDSTLSDPTSYSAGSLADTATYTNEGGHLTTVDEYAVYPRTVSQAGVITLAGGTSRYHNEFRYTKSFPNKTDFKNAAVLNEYALYYELLLNSNYKNMPDQAIRNTIDKDINGTVIFTGTSTVDIEREYNTDGLLSTVNVLSQNTPFNHQIFLRKIIFKCFNPLTNFIVRVQHSLNEK
jgi:hypothetical protein